MAQNTQIVKIGALVLLQFVLFSALNFQLFGMVTAYKMMELKGNLSLAAYFSARKTYLRRKKKSPGLQSSLKEQIGLGYKWMHRPMVAKYDRRRCSTLVLQEKVLHVSRVFL